MPSRLKIRERAGNFMGRRSRSPSLQARPTTQATSAPSSPAPQSPPPSEVQQTALNSASSIIVTSPVLQPTPGAVSPPPVIKITAHIAPPATTSNPAFQLALAKHIQNLSPKDQQVFKDGNNISVDALMDQVRKFDEIHSQTSRSRQCTAKVEGFLNILKGYLKGLTPFFAQQAPEISSIVIGGVNLIVDLGLRFAAFFEKLTDMMEVLGKHLWYLSKYAEGFIDSPEVQNALSDAYGDLLEFCKEARNVFTDQDGNQSRWTSFRRFLRVIWEPFEAVFDPIISRFRENVEIVIRTANITEHERLRLKETLKAPQDEDKERREILQWLSKLEFEDDHEILFSKRHGNTGSWLVESPQFQEWLKEEDSCLLWCHGTPGVGKSVLASVVVDEISARYSLDDCTGLAFVYYKYQNRGDQSSKNILSTLIKQLSRKKETLPSHLKAFYKQYSRQDELPSQMKLQAQLVEVSKNFDQVFIIIDALDECQDQDLFLPFITSLAQDSSTKAKIFVTSRREKYILDSFTKLNCPNIQIEAKKVDLDIVVFVTAEIDRRVEDYGYGSIDQELKTKIKEALVSRSNGMFLWVKYQLVYIFDQPSPQDIEEALKSLPSSMEATYNLILEKINGKVPAMKKLAKKALTWVLYAARPLSIGELLEAVSIEPGLKSTTEMKAYREETVIEACANLITVEDGTVRPVHYTVQEFFTAPQSNIGVDSYTFLKLPHGPHVELSQSCIQYMLFREFKPPPHTDLNWDLEIYGTHEFIRYTTCFWDYHIRAVDEWPTSLNDSFKRFLDTEPNLIFAYSLRVAINTDRLTLMRAGSTQIDGLVVCLSVGLLHVFQRFYQVDASIHGSRNYETALHHAAGGGSLPSIQALLDMGFSVNTPDPDGRQPLYYACQRNHNMAVRLLLEKGADINAQGGRYGNALQVAVSGGHEEIVGTLLEEGANTNIQGGDYGNALQAAAYGGNEKIVAMLLEKGADTNTQGGVYGNALQAAASRGNEKIVGILLEKGADINARGGNYGNALQAAASSGHEKIVEMLLGKGADISAQGGEYGNALQAAACGGNEKIVGMILEKGADINARGGNYDSALQAAAYGGNEKIIGMILEKGADINVRGGNYGSALQAAAYNGNEKIVGMFLEKGADTNTQGGEYGNALQAAASRGNEKIVGILLGKGADINTQGGEYGNALQAAAYSGHEKIVELLLGKGADINAQSGEYGNALQAAAYKGHEKIVGMLLEKGADVNARGGMYDNALQAASLGGTHSYMKLVGSSLYQYSRKNTSKDHEKIVGMILEKGADINAQGGVYGNALQAAASRGNEKIVEMLLEKGADINAQGGEYGNALQAAASRGNEKIVAMLLEKGADISAQGGEYCNILQAAVYSGNEKIVGMILEKGADINTQGGEYGNVLHAAERLGNQAVVKLILEKRNSKTDSQG